MSALLIALIVTASTVGYVTIAGIVYATIPEEAVGDERLIAGALWPCALALVVVRFVCLLGPRLVDWHRARRSGLPKATVHGVHRER